MDLPAGDSNLNTTTCIFQSWQSSGRQRWVSKDHAGVLWRSFPREGARILPWGGWGRGAHQKGSSQYDLPRGVTPLGEFDFHIAKQKRDQCFPFHYLYSGISSSYSSGLCLSFQSHVLWLLACCLYPSLSKTHTHPHISLPLHIPAS